MQNPRRKLATRKLNVIVNMLLHCIFITSEEDIKRATEDMQLAATYKDITEKQKQLNSLKHDKLKDDTMDAILSEITKLKTNNCYFEKSPGYSWLK